MVNLRKGGIIPIISITIIAIAFIISVIYLPGFLYTNNNVKYANDIVKRGTHIKYVIYASGEKQPYYIYRLLNAWYELGNYSKLLEKYRNVNFIIVLYRDYWSYWRDRLNKSLDWRALDIYNTLKIACNKIYLDIKIIDINESTITLNTTLIFVDGFAIMGKDYNQSVRIDSKWIKKSDHYFSEFKKLTLSRIIYVDRSSNEAYTGNGDYLGEWVFLLGKNDLAQRNILMLYSIMEDGILGYKANRTLSGVAFLLYLNSSVHGKSDYKIGSKVIKASNQIYMHGNLIRSRHIVVISEKYLNDYIRYFKENSIKLIKKLNCSSLILNKPILKYISKNKTLVITDDSRFIPDNLAYKPWKLIRKLITIKRTFNYPLNSNNTCTRIEYIHGVEYRGKTYVAFIGIPSLINISYSRSGILLYAYFKGVFGVLTEDQVIPSVISRAFGDTIFNSMILRRSVWIKLISLYDDHCCEHATTTDATEIDYLACIGGTSTDNSYGYASVSGTVLHSELCVAGDLMRGRLATDYVI